MKTRHYLTEISGRITEEFNHDVGGVVVGRELHFNLI